MLTVVPGQQRPWRAGISSARVERVGTALAEAFDHADVSLIDLLD